MPKEMDLSTLEGFSDYKLISGPEITCNSLKKYINFDKIRSKRIRAKVDSLLNSPQIIKAQKIFHNILVPLQVLILFNYSQDYCFTDHIRIKSTVINPTA